MEGSLARRRKLPPAAAEADGESLVMSLSSSPKQQQRFTALELAAAEQLIHLSESSSSPRSSSFSFTSASASASSPRSVSNAPRRGGGLGEADDEDDEQEADDEDDEQEVGGRPRRNRRLRPIAEIYAATAPIGGGRKAKAKAAGVE
uniref:Uncharacterized protein n=1 Tax=Oryza barthii TaxID=65489 RepID=A0A0D3H2X8_9ORYZ